MSDDTSTRRESGSTFVESSSVPVLLMAYSPCDGPETEDRWSLTDGITIGRKPTAELPIRDEWLSGVHFRIFPDGDDFYVDDLRSTNGTFIDGLPLVGRQKLKDGTVIRAGRSIFVFHYNGEQLLEPCPPDIHNIGGRFHVAPLLNQIRRL